MTHALILRTLSGESYQDVTGVANRHGQSDSDFLFKLSNKILHFGCNASRSILVVLVANATCVAD